MAATAVVTGANSGIGLATALRLAADGYEVVAGARREPRASTPSRPRPPPRARRRPPGAARRHRRRLGGRGVRLGARRRSGRVLVNNAGITGSGSVEETPLSTYQAMFDTNVLGVVRCTQQVLPSMRAAGAGRIVNISSSSAILSPPLMGPYASTKFAVESLSESLQAEVAPFGIRVVVVQAGTILTPIWGKADPPPGGHRVPRGPRRSCSRS